MTNADTIPHNELFVWESRQSQLLCGHFFGVGRVETEGSEWKCSEQASKQAFEHVVCPEPTFLLRTRQSLFDAP